MGCLLQSLVRYETLERAELATLTSHFIQNCVGIVLAQVGGIIAESPYRLVVLRFSDVILLALIGFAVGPIPDVQASVSDHSSREDAASDLQLLRHLL